MKCQRPIRPHRSYHERGTLCSGKSAQNYKLEHPDAALHGYMESSLDESLWVYPYI